MDDTEYKKFWRNWRNVPVRTELSVTNIGGYRHDRSSRLFWSDAQNCAQGSTAIFVVLLTELFEKASKNNNGGWCNEFTHPCTDEIWYRGPKPARSDMNQRNQIQFLLANNQSSSLSYATSLFFFYIYSKSDLLFSFIYRVNPRWCRPPKDFHSAS